MNNLIKIKNNKDYIFIASGIILLVLIFAAAVYLINFLFQETTRALEIKLQNNANTPRVNFDGLKKLGVIK